MLTQVAVLAAMGFAVSVYAYILEHRVKRNAQYKAACDLSDKISCTRTFESPYSALLFGIPNTIVGMLFYALMMLVAFMGLVQVAFLVALAGCLASTVLAYILIFKIKTVCLICTTIYGINIALLAATYFAR